MKVLIIDDNVYKIIEIRKILKSNDIEDIKTVSNQEDALELIENNKSFDLIITDMHYPLTKYGEADREAGFKLIEKLKKKNINISIIVCSSQNWNIPEIAGTVWFNELSNIESEFKTILKKIKNN